MTIENTVPTEKVTAISEQLVVLKNNFPQCFDKQGKFIVSKLQEILQAEGVDLSRESYSLNWLGKSYARVLANEPIRTMLSEDIEHNKQEQNKNSHNLLIQGDNLEVLKHLKGAYTDKIKMIYIDPPYNTGEDFVYRDDFSFSVDELVELAGISDEEAHRILDFTQSNSNSHSAWLTFMYPRLYIAKKLLRYDGVIFISIDDNEQAQLKVLCDEIFGEANFVASVIWEKIQTRKNSAKYFSESHDYILVYANNKDSFSRNLLPRENDSIYKNLDNDPKGKWKLDRIYANKPYNADYVITGPNGEKFERPSGKYWRYSEKTIKEFISEGRLIFSGNTTSLPNVKRYLSEVQDGLVPTTIFDRKFAGDNGLASRELSNILGIDKVLDYPKPSLLIKRLIQIGASDGDFVLDFFAGSATTAHAVLELNSKGQNINFICVQIPEIVKSNKDAFKAGYKTVFDIAKTRITKVIENITSELNISDSSDIGFKIIRTRDNFLSSSNYRELKQLTLSHSDAPPSTTGFDNAQLQDILTTWKGLDKILLSENLKVVNLGNYVTYGFGHVLYLVNKGFKIDALKDLIKKLDDEHEFQVSKLVLLGHHFDSATQREIDEAMKNYNNKKSIPVDVVVRY